MQLHRTLKPLAVIALLLWLSTMVWQTIKPLPEGLHVNIAAPLAVDEVHFLHDLTYRTASGERRSEQQIFDAVLRQIDNAQHFILLDYFLFNDYRGNSRNGNQTAPAAQRSLSRELADHLLARKRAVPTLQVLFITDPINSVYGGAASVLLAELQRAGIEVVYTDLKVLRDSNPAYSALWRGLLQWWGNSAEHGWLPDPFDSSAPRVSLRSWLYLLNFKANHRKVIVSDRADGAWQALVASANPHDASSANSNVALQLTGELAESIVDSEVDIAGFSGWQKQLSAPLQTLVGAPLADTRGYYLTEGGVIDRSLAAIRMTQAGDQIQLAMFYLSHRDLIDALQQAAERGVEVRLILDPNKDAFGIHKDGVPNRPVANELVREGKGRITVRWYRTDGEQFHTKLLSVQHQGRLFVTLGSANFTRRNLDDYNLEANVALNLPTDSALARQFADYFARIWTGDEGSPEYTVPFAVYQDESWLRYWRYRSMEATGLSTF